VVITRYEKFTLPEGMPTTCDTAVARSVALVTVGTLYAAWQVDRVRLSQCAGRLAAVVAYIAGKAPLPGAIPPLLPPAASSAPRNGLGPVQSAPKDAQTGPRP
jgi:hypothetical protein